MKKYILMGQIAGIGGWPLYMDARTTYLTEMGIPVYVVSISNPNTDRVVIQTFQSTAYICLPEIHLPPLSYTKRQRQKRLEAILRFVDYREGDEIFIESTDISLTMWGELLAQRVNGVNYSYLLHSHIENVSVDVQRFFAFKYRQDLLAGMSELTLPDLFRGFLAIAKDDRRAIMAGTKDPITEENLLPELTQQMKAFREGGGKIIAYFGTLTKPHFSLVCESISRYVKEHGSISFMFVAIGSSTFGSAERTHKRLEKENGNCRCIHVPAMYPVPRTLFENMDVCIGSWGSALNAAKAGVITVCLKDDVSIAVQGVMGITLDYENYYLEEPAEEALEQCLDDILLHKRYRLEDMKPYRVEEDYRVYEEIENQVIRPFERSVSEYYDMSQIVFVNKRSCVGKGMNAVLGVRRTQKVICFLKRMMQRNA